MPKSPFYQRLYVWSIALEPLLIFTMSESYVSGINLSLSRLLQLIFLLVLLGKIVLKKYNLKAFSFTSGVIRNIYYYFVVCVLAGAVGLVSGSYDLPKEYNLNFAAFSDFSKLINSSLVRPFIEYIIVLYSILYFVILPKFVLRTEESLNYAFRVFTYTFVLCIGLGALDVVLSYMGIKFLPRHFGEPFVSVGPRFHGLAGEPRDAFVYMGFGICIMYMKSVFMNVPMQRIVIGVALICMILTQSASGLIGVAIFGLLYPIMFLENFKFSLFIRVLSLYILSGLGMYYWAVESERILQYAQSTVGLWDKMSMGSELPYLMSVQMVNIYPLFMIVNELIDFKFLYLFIGHGLGSASVINNYIQGSLSAMANPHAQITRVLYESGIIGFALFVNLFVSASNYAGKITITQKWNMRVLMIFVLALCLAHRSYAVYICLGLLVATLSFVNSQTKDRLTRHNAYEAVPQLHSSD